jgi:hypothetical protein
MTRRGFHTRGPGAREKLGTPRPAKNAFASFIIGGWSRPTSITQPEHLAPHPKKNDELVTSQSLIFDTEYSNSLPLPLHSHMQIFAIHHLIYETQSENASIATTSC